MDISGSTVLVTGGAGFIGSHLVEKLLARRCRVKVIDSLEPHTHPQGTLERIPEDVEFIRGSILSTDSLNQALEDVDFVFHQAAFTGFDPQAARYLDVNAIGTARIYEVIAEKKFPVKKVVVASSLTVYGEGKHHCSVDGIQYPGVRTNEQLRRHDWDHRCQTCGQRLGWLPTDEAAPKSPWTAYGISKHAEEQFALGMGKRFDIPTVVLRYAVTYGPRQSIFNPYSGVITTFSTLLVNDLPPVIYEDGGQTRDWTYVGDVVGANLLVMEDERADFGTFNVGTGVPRTVKEVADLLAQRLDRNIKPLVKGEFRPGDIRHLVHDIAKLRDLGFRPRTSLEEGLGEFIGWFLTLGHVKEFYSELERKLRAAGELLS